MRVISEAEPAKFISTFLVDSTTTPALAPSILLVHRAQDLSLYKLHVSPTLIQNLLETYYRYMYFNR